MHFPEGNVNNPAATFKNRQGSPYTNIKNIHVS